MVSGLPAPKGIVSFYDGSDLLGTIDLATYPGGVNATFETTSLSVGTHALSASFSGATFYGASGGFYDAVNYNSSTSAVVPATVLPHATVTHIGQSNATPVFGQTTTLYVVVDPGFPGVDPTGTATFLEGSTVVGTADLVTENGQTYAAMAISTLGVGAHAIAIAYDGDATSGASTSPATTITVAPNTATAAGQSNATPDLGQSTTLYAVVAPIPGNPAPTGTITYFDGAIILGSSVLSTPQGQTNTSFAVATLAPGPHTILMVYSGDAANSPSAAATTISVGLRA